MNNQREDINISERLAQLMARRELRKADMKNVRFRKLRTAKWNDFHAY